MLEFLQRTAADDHTIDDLAQALGQIEELWVVPDREDFLRYKGDLTGAFDEQGIVRSTDADQPKIHGVFMEEGFAPRVFSTDDLARDWIVALSNSLPTLRSP